MKLKIFAASAFITVLLSGCLGGSSDDAQEGGSEGKRLVSTSEFSIEIPSEWEIIQREDLQSASAKNTLGAFRSNVRDPLFTANVVVVKNELAEEVEALDYAKAALEKMGAALISFKELGREETTVLIGEVEVSTLLISVEGREEASADIKRFVNITAVKGKAAYSVLGSFRSDEDEGVIEKVESMLRSFQVK